MTLDSADPESSFNAAAATATVLASPKDQGTLALICRRPAEDRRALVAEAQLCPEQGLVGDDWSTRGSSLTDDGSAHPEMQVAVMNARAIRALAGEDPEAWAPAGDQLFLDFDLSEENLKPGDCIRIGGTAVIEVTPLPHNGCKKFAARYGKHAVKWVNSPEGKRLHLRGVNARVLTGGIIRPGDPVVKVTG